MIENKLVVFWKTSVFGILQFWHRDRLQATSAAMRFCVRVWEKEFGKNDKRRDIKRCRKSDLHWIRGGSFWAFKRALSPTKWKMNLLGLFWDQEMKEGERWGQGERERVWELKWDRQRKSGGESKTLGFLSSLLLPDSPDGFNRACWVILLLSLSLSLSLFSPFAYFILPAYCLFVIWRVNHLLILNVIPS